MAFREITRRDLHVEQNIPWEPLAPSVEVVGQCARCGASFMAMSAPMVSTEDAVSKCAQVLTDSGWRFVDDVGPLCPACSEGPEHPEAAWARPDSRGD